MLACSFLPPGSVRIGVDASQLGSVQLTAFVLPDQSLSVIAFNDGVSDVTFQLQVPIDGAPYGGQVTVPAHGIITLTSLEGW